MKAQRERFLNQRTVLRNLVLTILIQYLIILHIESLHLTENLVIPILSCAMI